MTTLPASLLTRPITHRGLHDYTQGRPENSIEAIKAAMDASYGIEIDLQMSKDGVPMVFHDYHLGRLTRDKGPVAQRTADELTSITLIGGKAQIPTLETILRIVDGEVPLLIEIKDQDGEMGENVGPLEEATAELLNSYTGEAAVMSFNPFSVMAFGAAGPRWARGLTTSAFEPSDWSPLPPGICSTLRDIPDYDRTGASFISHEAADLARPRVADLKAQGAAILCWTVKSPEQEEQARKVADNITFEGYLA